MEAPEAQERSPWRRVLLILLSPLLLMVAAVSLAVGFAALGGQTIRPEMFALLADDAPEVVRLAELLTRCLLLPFQLVFISMLAAAGVFIYHRRTRLTEWLLGYRVTQFLGEADAAGAVYTLAGVDELGIAPMRPGRQRVVHQIVASVIALVVLLLVVLFSLGQFIPLSSLAIVATALAGGLAWGARLIVSDFLGGLGNLFENNYSIGDELQLKLIDQQIIDGDVEAVNLRFASLRGLTGELITLPHGDVRTFRNLSRRSEAGAYVNVTVESKDMDRALAALRDLSEQSPTLCDTLLAPLQLVCRDGRLSETVTLSLYGRSAWGTEEATQLAVHRLVHQRLADEAIPLVNWDRKGSH